jgi:hypothetical protein
MQKNNKKEAHAQTANIFTICHHHSRCPLPMSESHHAFHDNKISGQVMGPQIDINPGSNDSDPYTLKHPRLTSNLDQWTRTLNPKRSKIDLQSDEAHPSIESTLKSLQSNPPQTKQIHPSKQATIPTSKRSTLPNNVTIRVSTEKQ